MPDQSARPDPALWDEPAMHRALAARDVTTVYQALVKLGFTQVQIAALTDQSQSEVSEILKGRRVISYQVLKRIADGLGIPRGHLGLAYADAEGHVVPYPEQEGEGNPNPLEDDDVITRRILGAVTVALFGEAALDRPIMQLGTHLLGELGDIPLLSGPSGKQLDKHDIAGIRGAADHFREFQHEYGGGAIHAAVRGLVEQVVGAMRNSEPSRELFVVVSSLCRVAAWTAFEAGHCREFWRCHAIALDFAKESGSAALILATVESAGRVHILTGNHRAGAKLFELMAVRRTPDAVGWGLLGSAYAPISSDAARHALVRLRDAPGADTLDATAMIAHVSSDLGDYQTSVAAFNRVLPHRSGTVAVVETAPMAIVHLKAGEVTVGLRYAEQALDLNDNVNSKLSADALRRLSAALAAQKGSTAQDLARRAAAASQSA